MAEQPAAAEAPQKKSKKLIVILALVGLLGGAGGAYVLLVGGGGDEEAAAAEPEPVVDGPIVEVATLTTNVGGDVAGYVRVGIAAVLAEGQTEAVVGGRFPLLKDAALTEIARFDGAELERAEGMQELRDALTKRAARIWPEGEVLRVVLTELLVQ